MNVGVTGSHGYIGSVLRKTLTLNGYSVYACDNKPKVDTEYLQNICTQSFDSDEYVSMLVNNNVRTVFHLAASSLLGPSATDPIQYYWNNTARTTAFIQKLIKAGWRGHIIFSSTAAVYGDQGGNVTEDSPLTPCNHYGHSKLMCERVLETAQMYGINVTTFRYFNVAGAYDDVGQDAGEPHIITRICNAADGVAPLVVFGNDYHTSDGTCVRDYLHVRDVCEAQIHAMNHYDYTTPSYRAFNLGTQSGTTVYEIIEQFMMTNNVDVEFTFGGRREGDPAYLVANPMKFIVDTGFEYKYSDLPLIVSSAYDYYKRKKNGL